MITMRRAFRNWAIQGSAVGFLLLLHPSVSCSQTNRFVDVQGMGVQNCGQYVEHRRNGSPLLQQLYSQWAQGFISGYNVGTPFSGEEKGFRRSAVRVPDEETIWLFLDNFCRNRPLDLVANGAVSLIRELGGSVGAPGKN